MESLMIKAMRAKKLAAAAKEAEEAKKDNEESETKKDDEGKIETFNMPGKKDKDDEDSVWRSMILDMEL